MSRVVCCLLTYNRLEYAKMTIEAFYRHATPQAPLHIADDGSPEGYVSGLIDFARKVGVRSISFSNSRRNGYGANVNLATQTVHALADYVLMLEDDWELRKPLCLDELATDLSAVPEIDCIRLGYLSWTQPMWGKLVAAPNRKYIVLDQNSPEPHVFAGHPRLERVSYQRQVGPWPEGLDPNTTEFQLAHNMRARQGVAWPLGLDGREGYGIFSHIGTERAR